METPAAVTPAPIKVLEKKLHETYDEIKEELDAAPGGTQTPPQSKDSEPLTYSQLAANKLTALQEQTKTYGEQAVGKLTAVKAQTAEQMKTYSEKLTIVKAQTVELVKAPKFQTVTITTTGGAIILGTVGGAFGTACGVVLGTAAGTVPALFTFGLSLPAGALAGGSLGLCVGSATGAGAGALGGAAGGYTAYTYRVEIHDGLLYVRTKARDFANHPLETLKSNVRCAQKALTDAKDATQKKCVDTVTAVKIRAVDAASAVQAKAAEAKVTVVATATDLGEGAKRVAADPATRKRAACAAGGATVLGAAGGACGAAAGGTLGAAVGLIPAVFTFGLSIPICAAAGGGAGLCAGTALGSGLGAISGAAGYGGYCRREEIKGRASDAIGYLHGSVSSMGTKVRNGANYVTGLVVVKQDVTVSSMD